MDAPYQSKSTQVSPSPNRFTTITELQEIPVATEQTARSTVVFRFEDYCTTYAQSETRKLGIAARAQPITDFVKKQQMDESPRQVNSISRN
jgi:hypothetical protein